jgi:hypothetical protein
MLTYADACGRMQAARERAWQLVSGKIWDLQHSSEEYFPLDKKFHGTLIGKASVVVLYCIRQHTSAYVSIHYVSIRQHTAPSLAKLASWY